MAKSWNFTGTHSACKCPRINDEQMWTPARQAEALCFPLCGWRQIPIAPDKDPRQAGVSSSAFARPQLRGCMRADPLAEFPVTLWPPREQRQTGPVHAGRSATCRTLSDQAADWYWPRRPKSLVRALFALIEQPGLTGRRTKTLAGIRTFYPNQSSGPHVILSTLYNAVWWVCTRMCMEVWLHIWVCLYFFFFGNLSKIGRVKSLSSSLLDL